MVAVGSDTIFHLISELAEQLEMRIVTPGSVGGVLSPPARLGRPPRPAARMQRFLPLLPGGSTWVVVPAPDGRRFQPGPPAVTDPKPRKGTSSRCPSSLCAS